MLRGRLAARCCPESGHCHDSATARPALAAAHDGAGAGTAPDDFDALGVTLHQLREQQHTLHSAVLTGGANGVDGGSSAGEKTAQREDEQRGRCRFFGLPDSRCPFLRLWEDPLAAAQDAARLHALILGL